MMTFVRQKVMNTEFTDGITNGSKLLCSFCGITSLSHNPTASSVGTFCEKSAVRKDGIL